MVDQMPALLEDRVAQIRDWMRGVLETKEIPDFEINDETVTLLEKIMNQHKEREMQQNILKQQMVQETAEFKAEKERKSKILSTLNLEPNKDLSPKSSMYMRAVSRAGLEVGTIRPTFAGMTLALIEFQNKFEKLRSECESLDDSCEFLSQSCKETRELKQRLEKQFEELESVLPSEQRNVESVQKSMKFHSKKKKEYKKRVMECKEKLQNWGFSSNLSHEEIVGLGGKAHDLEVKLKPFRLQLESYKSLPADKNLARIKLHETLAELKSIEEELEGMFQNISLTK